jgi:phosphate transport system protein
MGIRQHFDERLKNLQKSVLRQGRLVEKQIDEGIKAFLNKDLYTANKVIGDDEEINALQKQIDDQCILIIAEEQPVARDLRVILNSMHDAYILERVGDNAVHIAKTTLLLAKEDYLKSCINMPEMGEIALGMFRDALDAHARLDVEAARKISERDEEMDRIYSSTFEELTALAHEKPQNIALCMSLLFLTRRFERIADHTTHICEGIIYVVTGAREELNL